MARCDTCGAPLPSGAGACPRCNAASADLAETGSAATPAFDKIQTSDPVAAPALGTLLVNRYRVGELLGRGGMGEVYRAEDAVLGQTVALKVLPAKTGSDVAWRQRLLEEVKVARRVTHPNVCRVHDVGESEGRLFLSMEYVDGEDLATLLRRIGRLAGEKALEIARQIAAGLAAAHAAGVLHRDLKPANVMLDREGRVRLADFGLAVVGATARGEVAGTPAYMAPEQLAGAGCDERTDLYALGLLLYELLTGKRAFAGRTLSDQRQSRESPPPLPSMFARDLDPRIEAVIMQCLARDPKERPTSALTVLTTLSGGDPMTAALIAGQTPSPSAVAASPVSGAIRPAAAWACLAGLALSMIIYTAAGWRLSVLERSHLELPPHALAARARDVLAQAGYPGPWEDEAWGFRYDRAALRYLIAGRRWDSLAAARPAAIVFWYRAAPQLLLSNSRRGRIGLADPPLTNGMASVVLDPRGRLLALTARPDPNSPPVDTRQEALLGLIGTDRKSLIPDKPETPPVYADTLAAWRGSVDAQPVRVELATLGGRVVHFQLHGDWEQSAHKAARPRWFNVNSFRELLTLAALVAALFLARDNIRRGRGDRKGAVRVASIVFGLCVMARLLAADHRLAFPAEAAIAFSAIERAFYIAVSTWLLYVALEPHVRRVWPERLVSWTRLLEGRWRDPMVARDVLCGCLVVWAGAAFFIVGAAASAGGPPMLGLEYSLDPLLGLRYGFAALLQGCAAAIHTGLVLLVLLFVLRSLPLPRIVSSGLLALLVSSGAFGFIQTEGWMRPLPAVALALAIGVPWVLLLTRLGLVAMVTGSFLQILAGTLPCATRLAGWHSDSAWLALLTSAGLALWGARYAMGARPSPRVEPR
jgi:hypothetical protein